MGLEDEADLPVPEGGKVPGAQPEDIRPGHPERAAVGRQQGAEDLQERGLAGAGRAHDGHDLALFHLKINALEDFEVPETFPDTACFDNHTLAFWSDTKVRFFVRPRKSPARSGQTDSHKK